MDTEFEILLNNQKCLCSASVPASLGDHFLPRVQDFYGLQDAGIDILCQHADTGRFAVGIINLYVREKLKVIIRNHLAKIFFVLNNGPDIRCAFGDMECRDFKSNCFNLFDLPEFSITLYPKATEKHYELFLIEVKDIEALLDVEKFKKDLFHSFIHQN